MRLSSLALLYAGGFYAAFMHLKHAQLLRTIIPFGEDPYDAIGSFAAISAVLLGLLAVAQACASRPLEERRHFLLRTCCAVFGVALLTTAADVVAMLRHVAMWSGRPGTGELLGWLAGMALSAAGGLFWVRRQMDWRPRLEPGIRRRALILCAAFVVVLSVYPDDPRHGFAAALAAIGAGILLLYAPLAALLVALVPDPTTAPVTTTGSRAYVRWSVVAAVGLGVGAAAFVSELSGDLTGLSSVRLVVVSATFVGAGVAGLLAAYAFLARPLGLSRF